MPHGTQEPGRLPEVVPTPSCNPPDPQPAAAQPSPKHRPPLVKRKFQLLSRYYSVPPTTAIAPRPAGPRCVDLRGGAAPSVHLYRGIGTVGAAARLQ
jgi:hypothetical protein